MTSPGAAVSADFRARYDAFIGSLDLQDVRISHAEIDAPDAFSGAAHGGLQAHVSTASGYREEESTFVVWSTLVFEGRRVDEEQPKVRVSATVEVSYAVGQSVTDDLFAVFSERNLPLNTWPYLREFVQNALARAGWPVYTLPVFKAAPLQLQLDLPTGSGRKAGDASMSP
jgi:hypothetical protein